MAQCVLDIEQMPTSNETQYSATDFTGRTLACRILHASLVETDDKHCPHISTKPMEDKNQKVKCQPNEGLKHGFSEDDLAYWEEQKKAYFGYDSLNVKVVGGSPEFLVYVEKAIAAGRREHDGTYLLDYMQNPTQSDNGAHARQEETSGSAIFYLATALVLSVTNVLM